jgi:hypothetical protein
VSPPNEVELQGLENELRRRTAQAAGVLQVVPPEARPSLENCAYCPVRHLCDEYWLWYAREDSFEDSMRTRFGDVQIKLTGQHGPSSWDGVIESGPKLGGDVAMLLRTGHDHPLSLHPNQRLRLLRVHISMPDGEIAGEPRTESTAVVSMGAASEAFVLTT